MIKQPLLFAGGIYFMTSGNSGFERYMLEGRTGAAIFDALLALIGVCFVWASFRRQEK